MHHEKDYDNRSIGYCFLRLLAVYSLALGLFLAPKFLTHIEEFQPWNNGAECLASAIYYEARGETIKGQRAVVDVIQHRAAKSGKNVCEVLYSPQQFQWTKYKPMRYDADTLKRLDEVLAHPKILKNETFLYFHATHVNPVWARKMKCERIGRHNFCKEAPKWHKT